MSVATSEITGTKVQTERNLLIILELSIVLYIKYVYFLQ